LENKELSLFARLYYKIPSGCSGTPIGMYEKRKRTLVMVGTGHGGGGVKNGTSSQETRRPHGDEIK